MQHIRTFIKKNIRQWLEDFKLLFALIAAALVFSFLRIGCPIRFLTGISCPGCGMSRALIQLVTLHFTNAIHLHPLVVLMPFLFLGWLLRSYISHNVQKRIAFIIIVLFTITYIIRIVIHDPVLAMNPQIGFIFRIYHAITHLF